GNVGSQRNMMNDVDIKNLTSEQCLMLTQESQTQGMSRTKFDRMVIKDIKDMTIAEYMECGAEIKRNPWGYAKLYTRKSGSTNLGEKCKSIYKKAQIPSSRTSEIQGVSFIAEEEEGESSKTLTCKQQSNEINPRGFTLPCTISNLKIYVMADVGAGINMMPKSLFEHLKLTNLKKTSMVVEMADMTKKPLGIVENILVKFDKFLFRSDFVVIDTLE
ncbi:reverse transcriptase domain-containing protein, partial [Tanacetum coccineum]